MTDFIQLARKGRTEALARLGGETQGRSRSAAAAVKFVAFSSVRTGR